MNTQSFYLCWKEAAAEAMQNSKDKQAATVLLMEQMREAVENDHADYLEKQKNGGYQAQVCSVTF